jgi:hypothetical protein
LNKYEKHHCSFQGEMLAAVWAIKLFRYYLQSSSFTLVTDHQPLTWLMGRDDLVGQHQRWAMMLQQYDFDIQHRQGVKHLNADALSRLPQVSHTDTTGARLDTEWKECVLNKHTALMGESQIGIPPLQKMKLDFTDPQVWDHAQSLRIKANTALAKARHTDWGWRQDMAEWWAAVQMEGLTVIELCGGLSSGLEALLRNGVIVKRYWYADGFPPKTSNH